MPALTQAGLRRWYGPVELVFIGPMVFHVELFWAMPPWILRGMARLAPATDRR